MSVNGDIDGSDEIYARGMAGLPNDPYFPFSIAMNAYLYRKDVERAARFLDIAARVPGAPDWYAAAAAGVLDKEGQTNAALQYLREQITEATDEESKAPLLTCRTLNLLAHTKAYRADAQLQRFEALE